MDVEALIASIEKNGKCKECNDNVEARLRTTCLATSVTVSCVNPQCNYMYLSPPPVQVDIESVDSRERSTDYAINILYVIGFISCGDGCTEAARILGLLGLPNDTTMERRSFGIIEERISPKIDELNNEIILENLVEEARLTMLASDAHDDNDFMLWKEALTNKNIVLTEAKKPPLMCSFDMGWQQRSSGHRYNSQSGHALLVGAFTRKPVCFAIKSKRCNVCITWKNRNKDVVAQALRDGEELLLPPHKCTRNHDGTSGSMESQACLTMVMELYDSYNSIVDKICVDDDASTRAMLKWSNQDYMRNHNTTVPPTSIITKGPNKGNIQRRSDNGKLPGHVPEPFFVADPNHRKKVLTGELLAFAALPVAKKGTMTKMDANRIGKNFAYLIRQLPLQPEEQYLSAGKAVLDHHFDIHDHCGQWCRRKRLSPESREHQDKSRFYRSFDKDAVLYSKLQEIVARFVTFDRLKEVAHGMDTQVNESFNNTFSWLAPKNKVYCGSCSLRNRLAMGIGIHAVGTSSYFERLFRKLGIVMTPNVRHFLSVKENKRNKRIQKVKSSDAKKIRKQSHFDKLKADESAAIKARAKRDGTYRPGQNMNDELDEDQQPPLPTVGARTKRGTLVCPHCGKKGHSTTRSKKCLHHRRPGGDPPVGTAAQDPPVLASVLQARNADDADDADRMDSLPLQDDPPSDMSFGEFQDCETWSDDDPELQAGFI